MTSRWWPTPSRPTTWFTAEQLEQSNRYNEPLRRVAAARACARIGLLGGAAVVIRSRSWPGELIGLGDNSAWVNQLLVGSFMVALAWWLPATAADWWFDRHHEPKFGSVSLPTRQLLVGTFVAGLGTMLVVTLAAALLFGVMSVLSNWWLVVGPMIVLVGAVSAVGSHRFSMLARNLEPLESPHQKQFEELASRSGLDNVSFWRMSAPLDDGCNALTTAGATRGSSRIGVTTGVLDADPSVQELLVAHELGHVSGGHLRSSAAVGSVAVALGAVVVAVALVAGDRWRRATGVEPADPRGLPALSGLVWALRAIGGIPLAWLSRAHERQADDYALKALGPVALGTVKAVHVTDRADLDPGFVSRLVSAHPPAAQRLQQAKVARNV